MLKRISVTFFCILMLFGCADEQNRPSPTTTQGIRYSGFSSEAGNFEGFKAAMLLPLSGKAAKQGEGLQNATLLAFNELNDNHVVLEFFDTQSTPDGALLAARGAISQGAKIIVGPLMSEEVEAISSVAKSDRVPVVSFSTSPRVLQKGIYSLGLLGNEQINTIVNFAATKGRQNFAIIVPDNSYGMSLARSAYEASLNNNVNLAKIGFYPPDTIDFSELLSDMINYGKKYSYDADITSNGLKNKKIVRKIGFDAIIIPESGAKLKSASSMLAYYDVFSPDVMILGTATWDNTNLNKETTLYGAFYPALSKQHTGYMTEKYYNLYGQYPDNLYSIAYDAVAMLADLGKQNDVSIEKKLLDPQGFSSLNGHFQFYENGNNKHNLKIYEVTANGPKEVDETQHLDSYEENFGFIERRLPQVYGKNSDEVIRFLLSDN